MLHRRLPAMTVAVVVAVAGPLGCRSQRTRSFAFTYNELHLHFQNGLRVVIAPDASAALVQVDARYEVGAREDPPGKSGLAHLVEHLMFQVRPGGARLPPLMAYVEHATSFFNGYTNWDSTHYTNQGRVQMLDWLLKIEAVRLTHGCESITEAEFLREREVVRNEIRQRRAEEMTELLPAVLQAVYPPGHAYARPVAGNDLEVASLTQQDVCGFIRSYYAPERATLIIAGNVDPKVTEAKVASWFGRIAARRAATRRPVAPVPPVGRELRRDADIGQSVLAVAWSLPPATSPGGQAARLELSRLVQVTRSSLFTGHLTTSVRQAHLGGHEAPLFVMLIGLEDAERADRVLHQLRRAASQVRIEFHDWARALSTREEREWLDERKARHKAAFVESVEALHARAEVIGDMVQFGTDAPFLSVGSFLARGLAMIDSVGTPEIAGAVEQLLHLEKATVILFRATGLPGRDQEAAFRFHTRSHDPREERALDPSRASRPLPVPARLMALSRTQRFTMGNGLRVILLPTSAMPVVALRLIVHTGHAHAGDMPGLPDVAADMLLPPRNTDPLRGTGMGVECSCGADRTVCTTSGVNVYLDLLLEGLERYVAGGRYDPDIFRTAQRRRGDSLLRPSIRAELEFERQYLAALFGADHPYTRGLLFDADSNGRITLDVVRDFHGRHYTAGNATLIVAGNFDPAEARELVTDAFGGWTSGRRAERVPPTLPAWTGPRHIGVVGRAGPQARIVVGFPAPAGVDEREAARRVLVEMMNLRVLRLRTRLGAAYSAWAGRPVREGPSAYAAWAHVDPGRAGEALEAVRGALDDMRRGAGLVADFVRARRKVVSDLLAESTVSTELAERLGFLASHGLEAAFYDRLLRRAAALPLADVEALIRDELRPEREVVVVLGERTVVVRAFEQAGIAAPRFVEGADIAARSR